jgi:hypothetical protein
MTRASSVGRRRGLLPSFLVLLTGLVLAVACLPRFATAQTPGAATAPTTAPADATTAPAAEEEDAGGYSMAPPVYDNSAEREFWITYIALPALAMLAVIGVGVFLLMRMRRGRAGRGPGTNEPPPAT